MSKEDELRALREARYVTPSVTKHVTKPVTVTPNVTPDVTRPVTVTKPVTCARCVMLEAELKILKANGKQAMTGAERVRKLRAKRKA